MGIFDKVKNIIKTAFEPTTSSLMLVSDNSSGYYSFGGDIYKSDIIRACIRPFATSVGKLTLKHIRGTGENLKVNPSPEIKFLLEEPNPLMSGQDLFEKLAIQTKLNNNAFAGIFRDEFGYATEIYPLPAFNVQACYNNKNELFLKFVLNNGKTVAFKYSDVIHIRQNFYKSDIFGDSPSDVLTPLMDIVNTTDKGIVKAIKNSGVIKWLIKIKQGLNDDDVEKYVGNFNKRYLSVDGDNGGAAGIDNKADITQVDPKDYVPNASQMEKTTQRIYSYFGTNEKIIQSKFSEDEWNAFFEAEIETIAKKLSNEYTRKIFSRRERGCANRIVCEAAMLQNISMKSKLELVRLVDRGSLTPNEWRETMNLAPIEGGDKPIRRLDTVVVNDEVENEKQK